jgi:hypothetical protein
MLGRANLPENLRDRSPDSPYSLEWVFITFAVAAVRLPFFQRAMARSSSARICSTTEVQFRPVVSDRSVPATALAGIDDGHRAIISRWTWQRQTEDHLRLFLGMLGW